MEIPRIARSEIGILFIDVQHFFIDFAFRENVKGRESIFVRLEHLLMLADWMDLPLIATFEIPVEDNGELPPRLETVFPSSGQRYAKNFFGCTNQADIRSAIEELPGKQIAVAGAETDVCILQSVLGLLEMDYQVFLLEDCLFTSEPNPQPALRRMYQAGAVPCTLKTMAYELVKSVDEVPWYIEGWEMKDRSDAKPFPEKFIPPEKWPVWEPKL